jgi:hypothetical protein
LAHNSTLYLSLFAGISKKDSRRQKGGREREREREIERGRGVERERSSGSLLTDSISFLHFLKTFLTFSAASMCTYVCERRQKEKKNF